MVDQKDVDFKKNLKTWLDHLPLVNLNKSSLLIYNALQNLKRFSFSAEEYLNILEIFHPVVYRVAYELRLHYFNQFTLSPRIKRVQIDKAHNLEMTFIHRYLAVLQQEDEGKTLNQTQMARLVYQAMVHCLQLFLCCSQIYTEVPKDFWPVVYDFYSAALTHDVVEIIIEDGDESLSIQHLMKVLVMLSMANLYQLQTDQIAHLHQSLLSWADKIELHYGIQTGDRIVFSIHSANPPCYYECMTEKNEMMFGLDTRALITHLQALRESSDSKLLLESDRHYADSTLMHLCRAWGTFPQRIFERIPCQGALSVSLGLAATNHFLQCDPKCISDLVATSNHYRICSWSIVNSSKNGYCLCTSSDLAHELYIGEIIGLKEEQKEEILIGTVRWIKYTHDEQLFIGVQLLSLEARAVGIRNNVQVVNNTDYLRALIFPSKNEAVSTVILPALAYQSGDCLQLLDEGIVSDITLSKCIEEAFHFRQFTFE